MAILYNWKEMSTAPRDGTCFWAYVGEGVHDVVVCYYEPKKPDWGCQSFCGLINLDALRWCPLPKDLASNYND
jgi:hypothetical protein